MAAIHMMPGDSFSTFDSLASAYQRNLLVDDTDTLFLKVLPAIHALTGCDSTLLSTHPGRKLFLAGGFENGEEANGIGLAGYKKQ